MGAIGGGALRLFQTLLYALEFCCAGIILGIYSYFLAVLAKHNTHIPKWEKAVEGISGAACLYLIFAVVLTCFLGGISFFAFIAIILDVLFVGGFIAIAYYTRQGAHSCSGTPNTPLGTGLANTGGQGFGTTYGRACKLNKACFAVAIAGAALFLLTALVQLALVRHHKKEKSYGPSPKNNYTSGSGTGRKFYQRKPKNTVVDHEYKTDAELGTVAVGAGAGTGLVAHHHNDVRPSHDTAYTGSTVAAPNATTTTTTTNVYKETEPPAGAIPSVHGGYYQPTGVGNINPYANTGGYTQSNGPVHTVGHASNF